MGDLTRNLSWVEVLRGSGADTTDDLDLEILQAMSSKTAPAFQLIREFLDAPISVVPGGGLRTELMNRRVGGAKRSKHLAGLALDLRTKDQAQMLKLYDWINEQQRSPSGVLPKGGLALYLRPADGSVRFLHFDVRGRLARWNGGARRLALA